MDYANRASFNHPLIVTVAIGAVWLALTGLYLIFKTSWRSEARWLRRRRRTGLVKIRPVTEANARQP